MQMKEVEKEIVTEVTMPRVKSLYRYKGQGMGFEKGEVSLLCILKLVMTVYISHIYHVYNYSHYVMVHIIFYLVCVGVLFGF